MDNNKVLIGFVVVLVAFLAFPVVMKQLRGGTGPVAASGPAAAGTATQGTTATPLRTKKSDSPEYNQAPLLNEGNLTGTGWQVFIQGYNVKLSFGPGGTAYVTHPMTKALTGREYIEGRWRVDGKTIYVDFVVGPQEVHEQVRISGDKLYYIYPDKDQVDTVKRF
jgi:hypothetical protein